MQQLYSRAFFAQCTVFPRFFAGTGSFDGSRTKTCQAVIILLPLETDRSLFGQMF
jgi:hypothetical protein